MVRRAGLQLAGQADKWHGRASAENGLRVQVAMVVPRQLHGSCSQYQYKDYHYKKEQCKGIRDRMQKQTCQKSGPTAGKKCGPTAGKKCGPTAGKKCGPTAGTRADLLLRRERTYCW